MHVRTSVCISKSVTIQYWHFLKAEARALKPPTAQAARLSAEKMVTVPRQEKDVSATLNSTPSSCKSSIQIVLHAIKGRVSFPLHIKQDVRSYWSNY